MIIEKLRLERTCGYHLALPPAQSRANFSIAYCCEGMSPNMEMQCLKKYMRKNSACNAVYLWNHLTVLNLNTYQYLTGTLYRYQEISQIN